MSVAGATIPQQPWLFAAPICPVCQVPMTMKTGDRVKFFGCVNYPDCYWMCWSDGLGCPKGEPFDGKLRRENERAKNLLRGFTEAYGLFKTYEANHPERPSIAEQFQQFVGRDTSAAGPEFTYAECLAIDLFQGAMIEGLRRDLFGDQAEYLRRTTARKKKSSGRKAA